MFPISQIRMSGKQKSARQRQKWRCLDIQETNFFPNRTIPTLKISVQYLQSAIGMNKSARTDLLSESIAESFWVALIPVATPDSFQNHHFSNDFMPNHPLAIPLPRVISLPAIYEAASTSMVECPLLFKEMVLAIFQMQFQAEISFNMELVKSKENNEIFNFLLLCTR